MTHYVEQLLIILKRAHRSEVKNLMPRPADCRWKELGQEAPEGW